MNLLAKIRGHALWLRLQVPAALLVTLLQRTPVVRLLVAADEYVAASPIGTVLRSAAATVASLGAMHSLAGATTLVASQASPISLKVGASAQIAFTVTNTINIASWKVGGSIPPGMRVVAAEDSTVSLAGPGTLDATSPGASDGYGGYSGGNPTTTATLVGSPTAAGNYTMTLQAWEFSQLSGLSSNTFNYTVTVQADAVVPSQPSFTTQPQAATVTAGQSVTFTAAADNATSYQWQKDGAAIAGATSSTLTISAAAAANAGNYAVVATGAGGSATSSSVLLTVNAVTPPPTNNVAPAFAYQPVSTTTIPSGGTVVFTSTATGTPAPVYAWFRNGTPISGATSSTLVISKADASAAGNYTVTAANAVTTVTSTPAALTVSAITLFDAARLINLSILTNAGTGARALTMGAVVASPNGSNTTLPLVIRGVGPSLGAAPFNISGVLADPQLTLNLNGSAIASNDNWSASDATAFAAVGAFALVANSLDAALVPQGGLAPGNYSVQVSGKGSATGTVIAEMYEAAGAGRTSNTPRLVNLSTLTQIDAGASLSVGFVLGGTGSRTLLIRGVGPSLGVAPFNIGGTMPDPKLELFNNSTGAKIGENDDWGGDPQLVNVMASVGAFPLAGASTKDAVMLITLPPGQYSAKITGNNNAGGTAIVEVYEVQ